MEANLWKDLIKKYFIFSDKHSERTNTFQFIQFPFDVSDFTHITVI